MNTRLGKLSWWSIFCGCLVLVVSLPNSSNAQTRSKGRSTKEVYTGSIIFFGGPTVAGPRNYGTRTRTFTLTIDCYTPNEEVQSLAGVLKDQGQDGLLKAVDKKKCGRIQIGSGVGRDVNVIFASQTEEGERKITILFDRWVEFFEARYGTRSLDYPFSYIELFVDDQKGKGEGTMIPLAKIRFRESKTIEIENFGAYPARLTSVRRRP
ncbi:MAG TPA: hypothetical protein VJ302_32835 [Blastocatellia bacterium]|nr:hypothetical protein [Blastocatellia bacterium]